MIKVTIIIGDMETGGTQTHLLRICPPLQKQGINFRILTLRRSGKLASKFAAAGIPIITPPFNTAARMWPTPIRRFIYLTLAAYSIIREYWIVRPDIVHFYLPTAYHIGGLLSLISPVNKLVMSRRSQNRYLLKKPTLRCVEYFLHKTMDTIIVNSKVGAQELLSEGAKSENIKVIYNGIDVENYQLPRNTKNEKDAPPISLITVANLIPYKGHLDLFNALEKCNNSQLPVWKLYCVGRDDGIKGLLENHIRRLGLTDRVEFVGEVADVRPWLDLSDIGILASHEEGFSNAVLECMAAGIPMIVTDVGGNSEAVINGRSGIVVKPHSPAEISAALEMLILNKEKRIEMGGEARVRACKYFDLRTTIDQHLKIYKEMSPP
ncbi:glycosyltransferase [Thalassospira tepidiphila]|uniref:glycosyltransferase n=1 Tax=Thalassospira tepidiphila TaxID=393657 RepID=UPI003AA8DD86